MNHFTNQTLFEFVKIISYFIRICNHEREQILTVYPFSTFCEKKKKGACISIGIVV